MPDSLFPLEPGVKVKVDGVRGTFTVTGYGKDGSVTVYGGTSGHEQTRSFRAERIRLLKRQG